MGDTREKIAFEKAGIIKPGIPVVTACDGGPLEVIRKQAASLQSPVVALKFSLAKGDPYRHFSATTFGASSGFAEQIQGCVGWIKEEVLGDFNNSQDAQQLDHLCGLAGAYQKGNVLLALFSLLIGEGYLSLFTDKGPKPDGPSMSKEELKHKLLKGLKEASWPGRYQILEAEKVILDGAHNPHGGALCGLHWCSNSADLLSSCSLLLKIRTLLRCCITCLVRSPTGRICSLPLPHRQKELCISPRPWPSLL